MTKQKQEMSEQESSHEQAVLDALLSAERPERDVYISRLGVSFKIQAIDGDTIQKLQARCTHYVGKGKNKRKEVDEETMGTLMIKEACIVPDWTNKQLLEKHGTKKPEEVIQKTLLAGEIAKISNEILNISGFDDDEEDIKN